MSELWLKFTDPSGVTRRERVEGSRFVIGRQPDCDLSIADGRLSRRHAVIERFGGRYEIVDAGSSNGTEVDSRPAIDPQPLSTGSTISLGGLLVNVEIADPALNVPAAVPAAAASAEVAAVASKPKKVGNESRSIPIALILAVPLLAVVLVIGAGAVAYVVVSRGASEVSENNGDIVDADEDDPRPSKKETNSGDVSTTSNGTSTIPGPSNTEPANTGPTPPPADLSSTAKVESYGSAFLRKIAANDPKVFLTTEQAKRVEAKVKSISSQSGLAENIKAAQRGSGQLKALATSKNMRPQFLGVAAIAKLSGSRGDVVQTAQAISETLDKLSIQLGNELADDCLLTMAAYDQGVAGETMKMRNMLQDLANKSTESSRTIRTIWFLQKQGKITPAEFDRALTFIAIGTIAQNPKEFGVNAEALDL